MLASQRAGHPIRKAFSLFAFLFGLHAAVLAQIPVSGRVTSSTGSPVDGATVLEKGTANGTTTKSDGTFSITVRGPRSSLVFSHVGFLSQTALVGDSRDIGITLQPSNANNLTDVVVIGYGERRKKDVTGAVSVITSKDIEKSTAMTPELALQGTTAGVQVTSGGGDPNSRPVIRVRGVSTFGYADPLYVVDGIPFYEGGGDTRTGGIGDIRGTVNVFTFINPDDIESISVLKDASAAAIYGVRASNGVILITTKKGKSGRARVDFSMYDGIQNIAKKIPVLTTQQFYQQVTKAYAANPDKDGSGNVLTIGQSPTFGPTYDPNSASYLGNNPTTDWVGAITNKNAPLRDYNVRVSGGSEGMNYNFSAGYGKTESPLKANNLERYTVSSNIDAHMSRVFSAGMNIRLVDENVLDNTHATIPDMLVSIPQQPLYDKNGLMGFAPVATGVFTLDTAYKPTLLSPGPLYNFSYTYNYGQNTRYNPLALEALDKTSYQIFSGFGQGYIAAEPVKGLRIKGSLGGQYSNNVRTTWQDFRQWMFNQPPGNPYANQDGNAMGSLNVRRGETFNLNKELTVTYDHTFAEKHSVNVVLNASDQFTRWTWQDAGGNVNYTDPQFRSLGGDNKAPYASSQSGILREDDLIGYMGRVSYRYMDKYYLDGTLRYDGSSRLAPGHKWDYFPSFAAAWRISSEDFFPKTRLINDLKIRGGWGKLGNYQSALYYAYLSQVSLNPVYSVGSGNGNAVGQQVPAVALTNFANVNLTWESVRTTNIGFDALLLNNHVNLTIEYFDRQTSNIIQNVNPPPSTGIESPSSLNVASVSNKGFEFQTGYNTNFGPVSFNVSGNLTTIANKVIKLNDGNPFENNGTKIEQGYSMNYIYGYKVGGIFQNQAEIDKWTASHTDATVGGYTYQPGDMYFQDIHGNPRAGVKEQYSPTPDSVINSNDRTYLGKTIPGYTYGFQVGAGFAGFDVSVLFQGVGDVQGYDALRASLDNPGSIGNMSTDVLGSWTPENHSTTMPRAVYNDLSNALRFSNRFVESAAYLRLKNVTLGYNIPKSLLDRTGFIGSFRVYVSALNLFTATKWRGLDPETDLINYSNGDVSASTPLTRQFLFGIRVSFN